MKTQFKMQSSTLIRRDFYATEKPQQQFPFQLVQIILFLIVPLLFVFLFFPVVFFLVFFPVLQQFELRTEQPVGFLPQFFCSQFLTRNTEFCEREVHGKDVSLRKRRERSRADHPEEKDESADWMEAEGAQREKPGDPLLPSAQLYLLS